MKSAGLTYQMVSTRPDERISESRVTSGTRSAIAVATIRRSQGSARTVLGIFIVASTTLTVTGSILTASDETRRCFKCGKLCRGDRLCGLAHVPKVDERGY